MLSAARRVQGECATHSSRSSCTYVEQQAQRSDRIRDGPRGGGRGIGTEPAGRGSLTRESAADARAAPSVQCKRASVCVQTDLVCVCARHAGGAEGAGGALTRCGRGVCGARRCCSSSPSPARCVYVSTALSLCRCNRSTIWSIPLRDYFLS